MLEYRNLSKNVIIKLIISLILSLIVQLAFNNYNYNDISKENFEKIIPKNIEGFTIKDNKYITITNDAKMFFDINESTNLISIQFDDEIKQDLIVQIYYPYKGVYNEANSRTVKINEGQRYKVIKIPNQEYEEIRVDIGNVESQEFSLLSVAHINGDIGNIKKAMIKLDTFSTISITTIILLILLFFNYRKNIFYDFNEWEIKFLIVTFFLFLLWSILQPFNSAPDEHMRYDIIKYIFSNKRLPSGLTKEIINPTWGVSYAFFPFLSGIISAMFMEFTQLFCQNKNLLFLAARLTNILLGVSTTIFIIKISKKAIKADLRKIFIYLICLIPQFIFLGTYLNNDMIALFSVSIMIYYWIIGVETNWNKTSAIGLAIGTGIGLLSYYNIYPFIIGSVGIFVFDNIIKKNDFKIVLNKFLKISSIVILISAWWFIRNAILYNGDIFALQKVKQYSNLYAIDELKLINRLTPFKQGVSILDMFIDMDWITTTLKSFFGAFGYMTLFLNEIVYKIYFLIIVTGITGIFLFRKKHNKILNNIICIVMFLSSALVVALSIYNSYFNDFQPQGRYVISILIPLMFFVTTGLDNLINSSAIIRYKKISINLIEKSIVILFVYTFINQILATYLKMI